MDRILFSLKRNEIYTVVKKFLKKIIPFAIWYKKSYYYRWIKQNEPSNEDLKLQRQYFFSYQPKISIVVPMYKTSLKYFKELLASVQAQTYDNWELCLADGSLRRNKKIEVLCATDKRIHYRFLGENKGISSNTNEAIRLATGDFIAFMDHDDTLAPFALYENVQCINEQPDIEFIYSDEDHLVDNIRRDPYLKPDYAPDTLRSWNYICHFVVMKRSLTARLGNLNSEFDGAQDYDYVLRASETTKRIHHIRKILYHWRKHKTSISNRSITPFLAGLKPIKEHIDRLGLKGTVKPDEKHHGIFHVIYDITETPSISIIIPNKDFMTTLKICVNSILERSTYPNYEIVIVENNSENEETFAYYNELDKHPKIRILYYQEKGFNYSKLINFGVKNCSSDYIVQLNNDTEIITPNWLELMLGFAQRSDVGAVGAKLLYPDGSIQHAGMHMHYTDDYFIKHILDSNSIQNFISVTGACMMSRKELFNLAGYMDEIFPCDFGDVDFCFKLRDMGFLIVYHHYVELFHHESKTRGKSNGNPEKLAFYFEARDLFLKKWTEKVRFDPYYRHL